MSCMPSEGNSVPKLAPNRALAALAIMLTGAVVGCRHSESAPGSRELPTGRVDEVDRLRADLALAQRGLHEATLAYLSDVELRRLQKTKSERERSSLWLCVARVVEVRVNDDVQRLLVAAGSNQGVERDTFAVAFRGLVGVVDPRSIDTDTCEVILLTDSQCGVPVVVERPVSTGNAATPIGANDDDASQTGSPEPVFGAVLGGRQDGSLLLIGFEGEQPFLPGSMVKTSGEGTLYEGNLHVGEVVGNPLAAGRMEPAQGEVRPAVDFLSLRAVLLARRVWRAQRSSK